MSQKKKEFLRTLKFVACSVSAGVIQFASFALFQLFMEPMYAHLFSLALSVLWNFTLNRKFTFCSAANVPIAMLKVAVFYLIFTPVSMWWTKALNNAGWNEFIVEIGTMLANFVLEYLYQRFFVFGKSLDTAKKSTEEDC